MTWGVGLAGIPASETDYEIINEALINIGQDQITDLEDTGIPSAVKLNALYPNLRNRVLTDKCAWKFARQKTRLTACGILDCSARTITFNDNGAGVADTITDSEGDMIGSGFESGDLAYVIGSVNNNGAKKIRVVEDGGIILTLEDFEELTAETLINDEDLKLYARPAYGYSNKYTKPLDCLRVWTVNDNINFFSNPQWNSEGRYILTDDKDENDQIYITYIRKITDATKFTALFRECLIYKICETLSLATKEDLKGKDYWRDMYEKKLSEAALANVFEQNITPLTELTTWQKAGR